ncbi:MAG: peptidylprolyl isomerase [Sphingobacteriaceae bacterium]|nr:peptidylprolyl isomerase [Sphingobacteriaceae bacterium]
MNKITMLLGSALLVGLVSCNKSEFEGFTKAENGLHYQFYTQDEAGVKAAEGDGVSMSIVYALKGASKDSVLFDSKLNSDDGSGVIRYILPKSSFKGSLEDAITMMAKNDSAAFIISADSFFLKTNKLQSLPPFAKPGDKLQVTIKLVDIKSKKELDENQKKQEAEVAALEGAEKPKLDAYLASNKITTAPTASGLIFIETQKGKGKDHPKATDVVTVHYTGTLLDGTKFDSSVDRGEPTTFPLNQVIPGWTEAIQLMSKGSKAKLIIPSSLGYGPRGGGPIPPFSTLVFEVELIDFKAGEAQPGM